MAGDGDRGDQSPLSQGQQAGGQEDLNGRMKREDVTKVKSVEQRSGGHIQRQGVKKGWARGMERTESTTQPITAA